MPSTWLEDINVLELSAVARPANRKRKLHQKSEDDDMPKHWIEETAIEEAMTKAALPDSAKAALKAAIAALGKAKPDLPEEEFKSASKVLAKLLGYGATAKAEDDLAALQKSVETDKAKLTETLKGVVANLEAEKPSLNDAIVALAELAGVTPKLKALEALPPEVKAEVEALRKAREDDRKALAEMQKSIDAQTAAAAERGFIAKAEVELQAVPMDATKLGKLLKSVHDVGGEAGATLLELLKNVNAALAQSALFKEFGSHHSGPTGDVMTKLEAKAAALIEKSDKPLTREQAIAKVLEREPELYTEYVKAQEQK